ncbi:hypothetical protein BT63DRAFT_484054 [Microthyrium microscopicum]|uniref:Uncharacterized protein n=1 Tax=Microthyrium microscopicum TaxID=703497 RepID=A0A6A6TY35_9PEZI|nr:hypothetical protein BT63DRAFT_484054 [Microthyrium microscopicum]
MPPVQFHDKLNDKSSSKISSPGFHNHPTPWSWVVNFLPFFELTFLHGFFLIRRKVELVRVWKSLKMIVLLLPYRYCSWCTILCGISTMRSLLSELL